MPSIVNEGAALEDVRSDDQDIDPVQEIVEKCGEADLIEPAPQRFRLEPSDDGFELPNLNQDEDLDLQNLN